MDFTHHPDQFPRRKDGTFKKRKKDKKKKKHLDGVQADKPSFLDRYRSMETKGNINNSALKTLGDLAAGLLIGPLISASLGKAAPIAGAALTFGGHYIGDDTSMMRIAGMSAVAHSMAKAKEYREAGSTIRDRLAGVKDDLLITLLIKRYEADEKKVASLKEPPAVIFQPVQGIEPTENVEGFESRFYEPERHEPSHEESDVSGVEEELEYNPWSDPLLGFYLDDDQPDFSKF